MTKEEYCTRLAKIHPHIQVVGWVTASKPVTLFCNTHKVKYTVGRSNYVLHSVSGGCKQCGEEIRVSKFRSSKRQSFLARHLASILERFGHKLTLASAYTSYKEPHIYNCLQHGEFEQLPDYVNINKYPCPVCAKEASSKHKQQDTGESLTQIAKAKGLHLISKYVGQKFRIRVRCLVHNLTFKSWPDTIRDGRFVCPQCIREWRRRGAGRRISNAEFLRRLATHTDTIIPLERYRGALRKISCRCNVCQNVWHTIPYSLMRGIGCPSCARKNTPHVSRGELEVFEWIKRGFPDAESSSRILNPYELDIYIPSKKFGIEYNGLYWHSSARIPSVYHKNKQELAASKGIRIVFVYEDTWRYRQQVVKKTIKHLLGRTTKTFYARKLEMRYTPSICRVRDFYERNHLQGAPHHGQTYGLFSGSMCVAAMTFANIQSVRGTPKVDGHYELVRYATVGNVVGGASKLFTAFLRNNNPLKILSYSDNDWFTGDVYSRLGFTCVGKPRPDYMVFDGSLLRKHKSTVCRRNLAKRLGSAFQPSLSEQANCELHGIHRIYNSGRQKWEWTAATTMSG